MELDNIDFSVGRMANVSQSVVSNTGQEKDERGCPRKQGVISCEPSQMLIIRDRINPIGLILER